MELLPEVLQGMPSDSTLCLYYSNTLSLISVEGRAGGHHCAVELTQYQNGLKTTRRLADNGSHGNWIQWL